MISCQATPLGADYKLLGGDCREYKLGMRQFESVDAVCDKCRKKAMALGHYPDWKCGDSPWVCDCGGNLIITRVQTNTFSKYSLVKCGICGKTAVASIYQIGSNQGWICPDCGSDDHNGSQGFQILRTTLYYNPKKCTDISKLLKEGQISLGALFG